MPTIVVPVFGELVNFGTYTFAGRSSSLKAPNLKRRRQDAYSLGSYNPVDLLAGGRAQRDNAQVQWTYHIVAPEGSSETAGAYYIEHQINLILALVGSTNMDGTSGELQTLSVNVYKSDGTFQVATASAAFVDITWDDTTRGPFYVPAIITFNLYSSFSF